MKITAVICEYNPLHNGHKYHIERARIESGCDYVLGLMSAEFVQRGEYAIFPASLRAESALRAGCDIVVGLPVAYSCAPAKEFAEGAVRLLRDYPFVDALCFGSECADIDLLNRISELDFNEPEEVGEEISLLQKKGYSYPRARAEAYKKLDPSEIFFDIISRPNNILAIEYLKALKNCRTGIKPYAVWRNGADYNSTILTPMQNPSSTALRDIIKNGTFETLRDFVPLDVYETYSTKGSFLKANNFFKGLDDRFYTLLRHIVLSKTHDELREICGVSEGLEYSLKANALKALNYEDYLSSLKSKRYTMARLKRICISTLLGIKKEILSKYNSLLDAKKIKPYFRILGAKKTASVLLNNLPDYSLLKHSDKENLLPEHLEMFNIDQSAHTLYNTIFSLSHLPLLCEKFLKI